MNGSEFSKSLLKSAKIDAPLSSSKTRALAHVERALNASTSVANAAVTTTNAVTTTKLVYSVAAAAVIAGGLGMGGGYTLAQLSPHAPTKSAQTSESHSSSLPIENSGGESAFRPTSNGGVPPAISAAPASSSAPVVAADSCKSIEVEPSNKCSTSTSTSRTLTIAVKNDCSSTALDFFWVDRECKESYRGIIGPSQLLWQDTREGDIVRLRDRVTHKLVKEFAPTAVEGAPDRIQVSKAAATDLPEIVVTDANAPITDGPPAECFHAGARAATLHIRNDRKNEPIALSWIWADCTEHDTRMIYPGKKYDTPTTEGHAWRIRDASGALLLEVPPAGLDTSTYLTIP